MDSSDLELLWQKIAALEARIAELEVRPASMTSTPAAKTLLPLPSVPDREAAPVSFVPPEQPSLESRIGSQWFNRIGIIAVLIGAAWFLKYAVDRQWLQPLARVLIGAAAGCGLIAWSERFRRRSYPVFSFSLKAVGTGLLYLALWASFSLFHLLSYPEAFLGMALVTTGNAWLCWVQRSEVLAAYAAIGGFLTPALLMQDPIPVVTLGTYLLLLNAGLFALLALGRWPRLLLAALFGTCGYLLSFAVDAPALRASGEAGIAWGFTALFFLVFSVAPSVLLQFRAEEGAAPGIALAAVLLNAGFGTFALQRLAAPGSFAFDWMPMFLAAWYAGLLLWDWTRLTGGALRQAHTGLVISLVALGLWSGTGPGGIGVNGPVIAGWGAEAALLFLLAPRFASSPNRVLASPVPGAWLLLSAAAMLVTESLAHRLPDGGRMFLNEQFGLYTLLIAVAVLAVRLAARQYAVHRNGVPLGEWSRVGKGAAVGATVLLLLAGALENHSYWRAGGGVSADTIAEQFWDSAWAAMLGVALLVLGFRVRWAFLRWQALALLTLAVAKVFLVDTRALSQGFKIFSFLGLGILLLLVSFIYQRDLLHLRGREHGESGL